MIQIKLFVFSDFQENTYLLYDETKECIIVDPGCYSENEKIELKEYITSGNLNPVKVVYTHCHIDHIFGAHFVKQSYPGISFEAHKDETVFIEQFKMFEQMFGINMDPPPILTGFLEEGEPVTWGKSSLENLHIPGHSPGSICFYSREPEFVIAGDVLFAGSIGRADLPGGNMETLLSGIREKLFTLPDACVVYSGHGPS
ncbi:MAG: MBL fold metallo-hydrolase, partial [Spirochaetales bacterium]|nr:MBL fold metallo-hydrolase [Spirochaetales bacterium]